MYDDVQLKPDGLEAKHHHDGVLDNCITVQVRHPTKGGAQCKDAFGVSVQVRVRILRGHMLNDMTGHQRGGVAACVAQEGHDDMIASAVYIGLP